jgi:hypothetical protein
LLADELVGGPYCFQSRNFYGLIVGPFVNPVQDKRRSLMIELDETMVGGRFQRLAVRPGGAAVR